MTVVSHDTSSMEGLQHPALLLAAAGVSAAGAASPLLEWRRVGEQFADARSVPGSAEVMRDGVRVSFAWSDVDDLHHVRLTIPALPGGYVFSDFELDGQPILEPARHVLTARDSWLRRPDATVQLSCVSCRPSLELDLHAVGFDDERDGRQHRFSVLVRRRQRDPDVDEGIVSALAELRAAVRHLQVEHARFGMGQIESLARQSEVRARRADQQARDAAVERDAVMARLDALVAGGDESKVAGALILAAQQQLSDRLDAVSARMDSFANDLRRGDDGIGAQLAGLRTGFEALRQADRDDRQQMTILMLDSASTLSADIRDVRSRIDNVFWRRWLRRLRGKRDAS